MDSQNIIEAIASQYGEGSFEDGLRKMFQKGKEENEVMLKVGEKFIAINLRHWEDLVMEKYAIHHAHAWGDAIIKLYID